MVLDEFDLICSTMIPTTPMQTVKLAWPIIGKLLGNIFCKGLINTVINEQRTRNPTLCVAQAQDYVRVTPEQFKSKTNGVMVLAMYLARDNPKECLSDKY